ncbi:MAG: serine/threonine protein kinase [Planctomycetales bacterium]|nr:serine/threonine protein kinase [Planctomycetales bacterium]
MKRPRTLKAGCPAPDQWEALLDSTMELDRSLQRHLEQCRECRDTLDQLGADAVFTQAIRESLEYEGAVEHAAISARIAGSVCALSSTAIAQQDPLCEHEVAQLRQLLAPPTHPELLGRVGRYDVEQLIGRGGMGLVFRGYDAETHRPVAIKTLAVHLIPIRSARERFAREAHAAASLMHPHIVTVYDVLTDGPAPALIMQYVAGPSLEHWLRQRGPLPWRQAVDLTLQLLDALVTSHAKGLVHRDIKPGNVLLEADGARALLTDFGLVRALDDPTLTHSGMLAGTPDYMSPEQALGETVDERSDLFSTGSLLYAMLTGQPPFQARDPLAVLNRICHQPHKSLAGNAPLIPARLAQVIDRLLEKQPSRRYASAAKLRSELVRLCQVSKTNAPTRRRIGPAAAWGAGLVAAGCLLAAFAPRPKATAPAVSTQLPQQATSAALPSSTQGSESEGKLTNSDAQWLAQNDAAFRQIEAEIAGLHAAVRRLESVPASPDDATTEPVQMVKDRLDNELQKTRDDADQLLRRLQQTTD